MSDGRVGNGVSAGASDAVLVPPGAGRGKGICGFVLAVLVAAVLAVFFAGAGSATPALEPRDKASPATAASRTIGNLRVRFIILVIPCPRFRLQRIFAMIVVDAF
jgi:hypothetical protein